MNRFSRSLIVGLGWFAGWMAFGVGGFSCSSAFGQAAGNGNSVDAHLPAIRVSLDGEGSVLNRVVSTPSPTPVGPATGVVFGAADVPVATPTPAPVQVVGRPLPSGVSVPGSRVLSAVAGAPGSDASGDFLDGALVVDNGNSVGRPNGVVAVDNGPADVGSPALVSPSPSPTDYESGPSATPVPGASVSGSATPGSQANPDVAVPVPTLEPPNLPPEETGPVPTVPLPQGSPQPQGSPLPQGPPLPRGSPGAVPDTAPVQDKVYDLVAGKLPDRNSVRGPAQPRVGFFPRAPEPDTAQKLFMQASGGDLPTEEAGVW